MKTFFSKYRFFIIILLISAFFLRFYKLEEWFFFNIDEDWFNYIVRGIIVNKDLVLIGWEMPGGLLTAPVTYYMGSIIMILFNHNLIGYAVSASLISSLTVILVFYVGYDLFRSKSIAFFSSLLFCFSYLAIIYSRITLTLYLGPALALLTYLSLKRVVCDKQKKWLFVLSGVFIFSTQEGSLLSLVLLSIITLTYFRKTISLRDIRLPIVLALLIFIPVLIFDLRHDFLATKRIINFFQPKVVNQVKSGGDISQSVLLYGRVFYRFFIPTGPSDINVQVLPCEKYTSIIKNSVHPLLSLLGLLFLIFFIIVSLKKGFPYRLISLHILIGFIGLLLFSIFVPGHLHEWFFVVYFPAFSIIGGYFIIVLKNKISSSSAYALLIFIILFNCYYFVSNTSSVGYKNKVEVIHYVKETIRNRPFSLSILGSGCNGYGYRYLFTHLGTEPSESYMDNAYNGWLYEVKDNQVVERDVYVVPLDDLDTIEQIETYNDIKNKAEVAKTINAIEVLIVNRE